MSDVGSSNFSETAASNNAAAPNGWPEGMAPSGVNDAARETHAALKRWWNRINGVKTTGGSANAQTCTYDVAEAAYYSGAIHTVIIGSGLTNTGAAAINISGLGAVTVLTSGGSALIGGELRAGYPAALLYNGTNHLLMSQRVERGTFTATLTVGSGSVTQSVSTGFYERIGNMVHVWGTVTITASSTPSGALKITNLPFTAQNTANSTYAVTLGPGSGSTQYLLSGSLVFMGFIAPNTTDIEIYALTQSGGGLASSGSSVVNATASLSFSATYRTAG